MRTLSLVVLLVASSSFAQSKAAELIGAYVVQEANAGNCSGLGRRCAGSTFESSAPSGGKAMIAKAGARICLNGTTCTTRIEGGSAGSAALVTGASTVDLSVSGAIQWYMTASELRPTADTVESLGAAGARILRIYALNYSDSATDRIAFGSSTASNVYRGTLADAASVSQHNFYSTNSLTAGSDRYVVTYFRDNGTTAVTRIASDGTLKGVGAAQTVMGDSANSAGADGVITDTETFLNDGTAKILNIKNGGTTKAWFDRAGFLHSTTAQTLSSVYPNAAVTTGLVMGGAGLPGESGFTVNGVGFYVSASGVGGSTNMTIRVSDGTTNCDFSIACNTATGPKQLANAGCSYAAGATLTYSINTRGDCGTGATIKNIDVQGYWTP